MRILVVDDEAQMRRALTAVLRSSGYEVWAASGGQQALDATVTFRPDLIVLDLRLPDMDGREVCARLRTWSQVPIIVLSVTDAESAKIAALDAGADDYLVKPFSAGELLARVRAAHRRAHVETASPVITVGDLRVDLSQRTVRRGEQLCHLTPKEYALLAYLAAHAGRVLTHAMILEQVWGPEYSNETHYLRVFVRLLRRKLEPDPEHPRYILTDVGVGYHMPLADPS
jgi:two-component system KDP operon response regulator KdpE